MAGGGYRLGATILCLGLVTGFVTALAWLLEHSPERPAAQAAQPVTASQPIAAQPIEAPPGENKPAGALPTITRPPASPNPGPPPAASARITLQTPPTPTAKQPPEPAPPLAEPGIRIALIIDDVGNQWQSAQDLLALPGPITLAILPFSPFAERIARRAYNDNKELMLHAPMEPMHHHAWAGGLNSDMSREELQQTLTLMLASVPGARGVNNHMGSALTQNTDAMNWVMETLTGHDLYFIDSRTSAGTRAEERARAHQVPSARRDVFLDNARDTNAIAVQMEKLISRASETGSAIGIGHPYPETIAVLQQWLPRLAAHNIELVPVSELVELPPRLGRSDTTGNQLSPSDKSLGEKASTNSKSI